MKEKKVIKKKLSVSKEKLSSLNKKELNALVGGSRDRLAKLNTVDMFGELNRGYF